MASNSKLVCVWLISMVVIGATTASEDAITCGQVAGGLAPCVNYLKGTGGPVPPACCNGVKALNSAAKTTADRQAACRCIKSTAGSVSGINFGLAAGLPGKCGVSIPFKISPNIDCSKVR